MADMLRGEMAPGRLALDLVALFQLATCIPSNLIPDARGMWIRLDVLRMIHAVACLSGAVTSAGSPMHTRVTRDWLARASPSTFQMLHDDLKILKNETETITRYHKNHKRHVRMCTAHASNF